MLPVRLSTEDIISKLESAWNLAASGAFTESDQIFLGLLTEEDCWWAIFDFAACLKKFRGIDQAVEQVEFWLHSLRMSEASNRICVLSNLLAVLYRDMGNAALARFVQQKAVTADRQRADAIELHGVTLLGWLKHLDERQDWEGMRYLLQSLTQQSGEVGQLARFEYASLLFRRGEFRGAHELLEQVLRDQIDSPLLRLQIESLELLGQIHSELEEYDLARWTLIEARCLASTSVLTADYENRLKQAIRRIEKRQQVRSENYQWN